MNLLSHLKGLLWMVAMAATQAVPSSGQQPAAPSPSDLQKQLEQLQQQYDATTRDLQQRIAALEQQIQKQKEESEKTKQGTVVSAAELAAEKAAQNAVLGESN